MNKSSQVKQIKSIQDEAFKDLQAECSKMRASLDTAIEALTVFGYSQQHIDWTHKQRQDFARRALDKIRGKE